MPNECFVNLNDEKKNQIIKTALKEFAENGFAKASTNRIVTECGISKGSLFKYFTDKEDLYFYLIDFASGNMKDAMKSVLKDLPETFSERIIEYSSWEILWYIKNQLEGQFLISIAAEKDSKISSKITERYGKFSEKTFSLLMKGSEKKSFGVSVSPAKKNKIMQIIKWVLESYKKDFLERTDLQTPLEKIKKEYISILKEYLSILENGIERTGGK